MRFKDDWDECTRRFDAFWEGAIMDRCCVGVMAPRAEPLPTGPAPSLPVTLEGRWTDERALHPILVHGCHGAFFGGEAFPGFFPNLGPGALAAFLGSAYRLAEDTVWFDQDPMIRSWEDAAGLRLQAASPLWRAARRMTGFYAERSHGEYCVAMTDIGGSLDVAAALRGTETLLVDLYDHPAEVERLSETINRAWKACFDELHGIIVAGAPGMCTWLPLWSRQRYYTLQCDFCAMISPEQFKRFVRPGLEDQAAFLERAIYHLDGPGQLCHLDSLLDMERLTGIQWVPGAGAADEADPSWLPVYRRIQEKGKNLFLYVADPASIKVLLNELSPEGLFLSTRCGSEAEARRLLDNVRAWSRPRRPAGSGVTRAAAPADGTMARDGGRPVRVRPMPSKMPGASLIGAEELAELADVVREKSPFRHYGIGTPGKVEAFEREARRVLQARFCLAVSSGTAALACAMAALGIGPGDEVILPGFGWYSDYSAVVTAGALPVFCDIDESLNLDPADFARRITPRTRAVIVVHYQGGASRLEVIGREAASRGIAMIEDCAQAFGGSYDGRPVGSYGTVAIASFQANKMITAGEGGLLWTSDETLFARAVRFHDLGVVRPVFAGQLTDKGLARPADAFAALQSRMSELQGAFLLAQVRRLPAMLSRCRSHHRRLREAFASSRLFAFRPTGEDDCGITLFLRFDDAPRAAEFAAALHAEGIPPGPSSGCVTLPGIPPVSTRKMVRDDLPPFGPGWPGEAVTYDEAGSCPRAADLLARHVAIGIGPTYSAEDVDDIITAVRKVERGLTS